MTTKTYTSTQLSNDRYHSDEFPQASGTALWAIYKTCPAQYRYGDKTPSKPMEFGTASHCIVLEQSEFDSRFLRGINPDEHEGILVTNKDLEGWLKERGIAKTSGKSKDELIAMIAATGENPPILSLMEAALQESGLSVVKHSDYDKLQMMRDTIIGNGYSYVIADGTGDSEVSIIDEELNLKCRIDRLLNRGNGEIWDYKTTNDVHPVAFGNQAAKLGYYCKMALQADLFERAYGHLPDRVVLMAQCTKAPFIPVAYEMTSDQLQAGVRFIRVRRLFMRIVCALGGGGRMLARAMCLLWIRRAGRSLNMELKMIK